MENSSSAGRSSFFVSSYFILTALGLMVFAGVYQQQRMAAFLGFVFVLALGTRIWGALALRSVTHAMKMPLGGLFPGQEFTMAHIVHNDKLLPLFWLEVLLPCSPTGCVTPPPEDVVVVEKYDRSTTQFLKEYYCLYSFSLIKWRERIHFNSPWKAERRGILLMKPAVLRSGDGFGLSVADSEKPSGTRDRLIVYPALVEVSITRILADIWDSMSQAYGYLEDTTLIKGVRDYIAGDSARRINHRLAARGQGLKVNQFEVVSPDSVLFCFDAASFDVPESFEESVSIVASLIVEIAGHGINVGLTTPASPFFPQTTVYAAHDEQSVAQMLELLAGLTLCECKPLQPFDIGPSDKLGQIYVVVFHSEAVSSADILEDFPYPDKLRLLVAQQDKEGGRIRSIPISTFRRGL